MRKTLTIPDVVFRAMVEISRQAPPDRTGRSFLFLQGPCGPFFSRLARALERRGAQTLRLALNGGDARDWHNPGTLLHHRGPEELLSATLRQAVLEHRVTDIVLFDDTRTCSRAGLWVARGLGLMTHCFGEGYFRPGTIAYERAGTHANSRIRRVPPDRLPDRGPHLPEPAQALRGTQEFHDQAGWAARYHLAALRAGGGWNRMVSEAVREGGAHVCRAALTPLRRAQRPMVLERIRRRWPRYFLVLLQPRVDASARSGGIRASALSYARTCMAAHRAAGCALPLVFLVHPLDSGRERLVTRIGRAARKAGMAYRVAVVDGGATLPALLDGGAAGVLTLSDPGAFSALIRGLPVHAAEQALCCGPGLACSGDMATFMRRPEPPDAAAVRNTLGLLAAAAEVRGSFYTSAGVSRLAAHLPDLILNPVDPFDALLDGRGRDTLRTG